MQKYKSSYFDVIFTLPKHSAKHWNWRDENFKIADPNQNYYYVVGWLNTCAVLYYGLHMMRLPSGVVRETGFMVM